MPTEAIPFDAPLHEILRRHARRTPAKPAFIWYGSEVSYAELDSASDAFAARLAALGVRRGEPVVLYLGNCPQYVAAHLGIQKTGAVVCPCGPLNKEHELRHQLGDLGARFIVAAAPLLATLERVRARTAVRHVFAVHCADGLPDMPSIDVPPELLQMRAQAREPLPHCEGLEDFEAVVRAGGVPPAVELGPDDLALMTYTSGTTGLPKGAMLSHDNVIFKTAMTAATVGVAADDVLLAVAPLYHIAGMLMGIDVTLYTGATSVLLWRFDALAVLQATARHRVSWWYSIAPMNIACMALPQAREFDLGSLRANPVTSFGVVFTEALARQWRELAPHCESYEAAYGLSETHTCDTVMPRDAVRWGTQGRALPGVELRILDPESGAELPCGGAGEIVLKSRGNFKGYWNQTEATARTLRDGWVHTGDMGRVDEAGYLRFMGRFKEMIKVSGYSVFPEEVEAILVRHPAVAQAAAIGIPDTAKGEVVQAFVVRRAGQALEADALIAWARENMAPYKVPRSVRFVDSLPATGAGKVLRRLLKDAA